MLLVVKIFRIIFLLVVIGVLTACYSSNKPKKVANTDLVECCECNKSQDIVLAPIPIEQRTLFLQIRNFSNKAQFDVNNKLEASLKNKGYTLVANPELAKYVVQVNIVNVAKTDFQAAKSILDLGYGKKSNLNLVNSPDYMAAVVDLQVSEKIGFVAEQAAASKAKNADLGNQNNTLEYSTVTKTKWQRQQTRFVLTNKITTKHDNKKNLQLLAKNLLKHINLIF